MNFLHIHSTYSIGDSAQSPDDIVKRIKELGGKNVTLTDHRTLLGTEAFMAAGEKYGINTIPGMEGEVSLPEHIAQLLCGGDENADTLLNVRNHILLVPFDYEGFQAISFASRAANLNLKKVAQKSYPCMTDRMLMDCFAGNEHLFATSACIQGPIGYILLYNMRLQRKIDRSISLQKRFLNEYETYVQAEEAEKEAKQKMKTLSKERTSASKALKKPFQTKVERLKKALETEEHGSPKWVKAKSDLDLAEAEIAIAKEDSAKLTLQIEQWKEKKEESAKAKANVKKGYNKYFRAEEEKERLTSRKVDPLLLYQIAKMRLNELKRIFPYFYIEMQYHGLEEEAYVMPILLKLAAETNTPIIAANDAHITDSSDTSIEARRLIRFNFFMKSESVTPADREMYIKTGPELVEMLSRVIPEEQAKEAVKNTEILERCHVDFPAGKHYPKVKDGASFSEALESARQRKIAERSWNDIYEQRYRKELDVITKMGYADYHMVVEQFCRIGRLMGRVPLDRRNEIYDHFDDLEEWVDCEGFDIGVGIGPGRGSAAGSLACYLLGITNIDPIKYNLLFERFLNPERVTMPDIDTDVATSIRPILIAYLRWYYGNGAVCSIATVTTYGAKGAVKLAGRDRADQLFNSGDSMERASFLQSLALKPGYEKWEDALRSGNVVKLKSLYQHEVTYFIADMIPEDPGTTLESCEADILSQIDKDPEKMLIWRRAKLIEGAVSGIGVHAGGIIISDNNNVNEYVPLAWNEEKEVWVAQCDMNQLEKKGLLKMDLLGLNTLDINNLCISYISRYHGKHINLDTVPFEDQVFQNIYATGNTNGVFQFEGSGMKEMLRRFGPTTFEDIILLVAAYRPGPMQYLDNIIEVKNGRAKISYKHHLLEPILSNTYGAVIYQEQVMQIFQRLAGYSLGGADQVRRAMSKKKTEKLAVERQAFIYGDDARNIEGCIKNGISEKVANEIFDELMEFAKYAFNKSHAAAYALVSYQTAWLKYHYPAEFICALFESKTQDKFAPIIADCNQYNVELLPPDINASYYNFVIENGNIRYGFRGIKGVGSANEDVIIQICEERKKRPFTSIRDFLKRTVTCNDVVYSIIPTELLTNLIDVGAFDLLFENREALKIALTEENTFTKMDSLDSLYAQIDSVVLAKKAKSRQYNWEKEIQLLGTICSEHPLEQYGNDAFYGCDEIASIASMPNDRVNIFGLVVSAERVQTKKGPAIKISLQGKTGVCTIMVTGAYVNSIDQIDSYLYRVVKVSGKCFNGTVYANHFNPLTNKVKRYTLILDNIELMQNVCRFADDIHKEKRSDDNVDLTIWFYLDKNGQRIQKVKIRKRWCNEALIRKLVSEHVVSIGKDKSLQKA